MCHTFATVCVTTCVTQDQYTRKETCKRDVFATVKARTCITRTEYSRAKDLYDTHGVHLSCLEIFSLCTDLFLCKDCAWHMRSIQEKKNNTRKETCNAGSRIVFRGLILKLFSPTSFQEREHELHFTDIQPTFRFFRGVIHLFPTTRTRTFDRKTFSRSLFRKRNHWGNSWGLRCWNFNNFVIKSTAKLFRRNYMECFKREWKSWDMPVLTLSIVKKT